MSKQKFVLEKLLLVRVVDENGNPVTDWVDVPESACCGMSPDELDYEDERLKE